MKTQIVCTRTSSSIDLDLACGAFSDKLNDKIKKLEEVGWVIIDIKYSQSVGSSQITASHSYGWYIFSALIMYDKYEELI